MGTCGAAWSGGDDLPESRSSETVALRADVRVIIRSQAAEFKRVSPVEGRGCSRAGLRGWRFGLKLAPVGAEERARRVCEAQRGQLSDDAVRRGAKSGVLPR